MFRRKRHAAESRPGWEDEEVLGTRESDGWWYYQGRQFHSLPVVSAALAEAPSSFVDLTTPVLGENPVPREVFLGSVVLLTGDGRSWELGLSDDHMGAIDTSGEMGPEDLVVRALAEAPELRDPIHRDREAYTFLVADDVRASAVVAAVYRALTRAYRDLAAHVGLQL